MKVSFLLLFVSGIAIADDAAILRCRAISDATARLACYDALVVPTSGAGVAKPVGSAGKGGAQQTTAAQSTRAQPALQQPSPQQAPDQFGLEQKLANKGKLDAIESTIPGSFEGWTARSNIRLANGQVWQISDDSARAHYVDNPKVRIRRGALGSFYLEIQGTNVSPRVKRVQ